MKIAILGGGFTGLTAAYHLAKRNHQVTVFEKEKILGGLASGFKTLSWDWYLERTVHHIFANDNDILNFAKKVGFNKIFFKKPETASLYKNSKLEYRNSKQYPKSQLSNDKNRFGNWNLENSNLFRASNFEFRIFPLDTPYDLLRFPLLSFSQKIWAGLVLAFLKFSPFFKFYQEQTAAEFLKKNMGDEVWNILWWQLFRKKFGKYAEKILASFIWARIKKRTKKLGYIEGGFQSFIDYLENQLINLKVKVLKEMMVKTIKNEDNKFILTCLNQSKKIKRETFDLVISTLPTPVLVKIGERLFPKEYLKKLKKIKYLHALSLILETDKPIIPKTYWLNVAAEEIPIMGIFQQTNFVDKKYYGGKHICYFGWYVEEKNKLWRMNKKEIFDFVFPYLKRINPNYSITQLLNYFIFKAPFAQPIFDKEFLKNKPDFKTPIKNFYIANLDMTYPYDRGTNYAVKLGKEVAQMI